MEPLRPYDRLPSQMEHGGKIYDLDLSYAAFFAALDALQDPRLSDQLRLDTALEILVRTPHESNPELLQAVLDLLQDDRPHTDGPKTLDIVQDWPYICAAFRQAYGIDLYEDKGLHILQFRAYLQAIPKETKLAEIIGIRAAPVPAPTKYNQQQIAELTRLKATYALRGDASSFQSGLAKLFDMLSMRAK